VPSSIGVAFTEETWKKLRCRRLREAVNPPVGWVRTKPVAVTRNG
jgi:hypothetical protein